MTTNGMPTFIITSQTEDGFIKYIYSSPDSQFINIANLIILPNVKLFKMLYDSFDNGFKFRLLIHPKMKDSGDIESGERIFHSLDDLSIGNIPFITRSLSIREKCKIEDKNFIQKSDGYLYFDATRIDRDDFIKDIPVYEKKSSLSVPETAVLSNGVHDKYDFGIITALYKDEFEQIKKVFNLRRDENLKDEDWNYYVGNLHDKKIIAAYQNNSGVEDATNLATRLISKFSPKYIFMTGVCGAPELEFGSVVISKFVFNINKGKIKERTFFKELEVCKTHDLIINKLSSGLSNSLTKVQSILLTDEVFSEIYKEFNFQSIKAVIEPTACSSAVVSDGNYYKNVISNIDRKTAAVEMEGYGIMRAAELTNNGSCKAIVLKGVMDHADGTKNDHAKKFAALTSALFLKDLLENDVLG